jgi:5-methylcytosine-specific restriction endonuclease McrA
VTGVPEDIRYRFEVGNGFDTAPEVLCAGNEALGAWLMCATWSAANKTPGRIPRAIAEPYGKAIATTLVRAGLWNRAGRNYVVPSSWYWRFTTIRRRDQILTSLRERIYKRDGYKCVTCGSGDDLTLDHIYPKSLGGATTEDNLQTLCRSCNSIKGVRV